MVTLFNFKNCINRTVASSMTRKRNYTKPKILKSTRLHQELSKQEARDLCQGQSMDECLFCELKSYPSYQPNKLWLNGYVLHSCFPSALTSCCSIFPWGHNKHLHPMKKTAFRDKNGTISACFLQANTISITPSGMKYKQKW
jgi:hypothetical protein